MAARGFGIGKVDQIVGNGRMFVTMEATVELKDSPIQSVGLVEVTGILMRICQLGEDRRLVSRAGARARNATYDAFELSDRIGVSTLGNQCLPERYTASDHQRMGFGKRCQSHRVERVTRQRLSFVELHLLDSQQRKCDLAFDASRILG